MNPRPPGYEPGALPLSYPATVPTQSNRTPDLAYGAQHAPALLTQKYSQRRTRARALSRRGPYARETTLARGREERKRRTRAITFAREVPTPTPRPRASHRAARKRPFPPNRDRVASAAVQRVVAQRVSAPNAA